MPLMVMWHALVDIGSKAVLTISPRIPVVVFLRECIIDTTYATNVNAPHYTRSWTHAESFFLARGNPDNYPQWTWNKKERTLVRTRDDILSSYIIERSRLATAKARVISDILTSISIMRLPLQSGIDFQETVYIEKRRQAQRFKDTGYDDAAALDAPYVLQYADLKEYSLQQAADDILFQAQLDEDRLVKSEFVRMKYLELVRAAKKPEEMPPLLEQFRNESFKVVAA